MDHDNKETLEIENDFDCWNSLKQEIHSQDTSNLFFKENDIWFCSVGKNIGSEQNGQHEFFERPVLVFKKFNQDIFLGFPLTGREKLGKHYYFLPNNQSSVILSQGKLFDKKRLNRKVSTIHEKDRLSIFGAFIKLIV